jgi:hypothetical protein
MKIKHKLIIDKLTYLCSLDKQAEVLLTDESLTEHQIAKLVDVLQSVDKALPSLSTLEFYAKQINKQFDDIAAVKSEGAK